VSRPVSADAVRRCACCRTVLQRGEGESPKAFFNRRTCGAKRCITELRSKVAANHTAPRLAAPAGEWPAEMAATKPFADDVPRRRYGPARLAGPASLAGGCSSSSGWGI